MKVKKTGSPENLDWPSNLHLSSLSATTKQRIAKKILNCQKEIFSWSVSDIGDMRDLEMEIELTNKVPVSEPLGQVPRQLYEEVKNYIDDVITNGWVRKSYLDCISPMECVRRKDSCLKLCIDYRKLNLTTIPDKKPINEDILDNLWCAVLVHYTRYVKDVSSRLHP